MINEIPDNLVPRDNDELVRVYRQFVSFIVRKYNRVDTNYDDLLQHIWMKLLEVNVIEKYEASGSLPDTLTGEQAAAYCRVPFDRFKVAIWGGIRNKVESIPKPISGNWSQTSAVYKTSEVEKFAESGFFRETQSYTFEIPRSKAKFKPYLARCIHNIWSNWCRTRSRKYKETYMDPLEDGTAWESLAVDPNGCKQEMITEVSGVLDRIDRISGGSYKAQITQMLVSGLNMTDIVQQLSLPKKVLRFREKKV